MISQKMAEVPGSLKLKRRVDKAKSRLFSFNVLKHEVECELQGISAWLLKVK